MYLFFIYSGIRCELAAFLENPDGTDPQLIDSGSAVNATQLKSCEESDVCAKIVKEQVLIFSFLFFYSLSFNYLSRTVLVTFLFGYQFTCHI